MVSKIGKEAVNTFSGGMNADLDKSIIKSNQYRYAENIRVSVDENGTFGSISPVEDQELIVPNAFEGDDVLHSVSSREMSAVFIRIIILATGAGRKRVMRATGASNTLSSGM